MKKYFIPLGMLAGGLLGLIVGLIINFAVPVVMFAGAAVGIIAGAAAQLVINQTYPNSYFEKKKAKGAVDTSLFSETDIAYREAYTASMVYRNDKAVEDIDIDDYLSDDEKLRQKRMQQEQRWKQQANHVRQRREQEEYSRTQTTPQQRIEQVRDGENSPRNRAAQGGMQSNISSSNGAQRPPQQRRGRPAGGAMPQRNGTSRMQPSRQPQNKPKQRVVVEEEDD